MPHAVTTAFFTDQPKEHAFAVTRVDGTVPRDLDGTFLRNGPGIMKIGDSHLNFFDGHALVAGMSFHDGRGVFRSRLVRTPLLEAELSAGRILKRRVLTNLPARWKNFGKVDLGKSAMHDVYAWGEGPSLKVVAGNDPGHFAMDPRNMATTGPERWGGAQQKEFEMCPMPYRDTHTGNLVGWLKKVGKSRPDEVKAVEVDASFRVVKETPFHKLDASPVPLHDHRATARFVLITENPYRLSVAGALWGAKTVYDSLDAPPGAVAHLLLLPRDGGPLLRVGLPTPWNTCFHIANAYDDGENVVADVIAYADRIAFGRAVHPDGRRVPNGHGPMPTVVRVVVSPREGRVVSSRVFEGLHGDAPEVADHVMGKRHRYIYLPALDSAADVPDRGGYFFAQRMGRLDVDSGEVTTWNAGTDASVSPASIVMRPGATAEDEAWLLAWVLREGNAQVVVLDARRLADGPVATLHLGIHLPGVSHVRWADKVQLDGGSPL